MLSTIGRRSTPFLLLVTLVFVWGTPAYPEPSIEVPEFVLVDGVSRLRVKRGGGKFGGATLGRIDFRLNGQTDRCALQLEGLLTLIGDCVYSRNNKIVRITPDPESAENAPFTFLEPSIFQSALRDIDPGTVSLKIKIKLKQKNGEVIANVRFKMKFIPQLALLPENRNDLGPEVVEPFPMTYKYKGKTPKSQ